MTRHYRQRMIGEKIGKPAATLPPRLRRLASSRSIWICNRAPDERPWRDGRKDTGSCALTTVPRSVPTSRRASKFLFADISVASWAAPEQIGANAFLMKDSKFSSRPKLRIKECAVAGAGIWQLPDSLSVGVVKTSGAVLASRP